MKRGNEMYEYTEAQWRWTCQRAAKHAHLGAGLTETLWNRNMHGALAHLLHQMAPEDQRQALKIAQEFGYMDDEALEEDAKWNAEHGYCVHGLEPHCCPVGCGDWPA